LRGEAMSEIDFTDYDKITDTLMNFDNVISLKFSVLLSKNSKTKDRNHIHSEWVYPSKYMNTNESRSITRWMNYYFILDIKGDFTGSVILRPQDVEVIKMLIDSKILPWFFDASKRVFQIKENKMFLKGEVAPAIFPQNEYKYIMFTPMVLQYEDNNSKEGIRMYLNNDSTFVDIDIDKFMGFVNIIKCTDMYNAACNLINYAKMPPYGVNVSTTAPGLGSSTYVENREPTFDKSTPNKRGNNFLNNK
jgi:hypothetical protein